MVIGKNSDLQWGGGGRVRKKGVAQGRNSPFSGGGGFGGGEKVSSMAARAYHPDSSYSRHQISSNTLICLFPSDAFLPRTYYFLHISQPAEICRTDRLGAPGESCHVTYFGLLCYRNSSCVRKSITLMFMSSSRIKCTLS